MACETHDGSLEDFTNDAPKEGSPSTPGLVGAAEAARLGRRLVRMERKVFNDKMEMPDGRDVEFWGFEDEEGNKTLPSPMMRVQVGDIVQVTLKPSKGPHTIHHHGIEPDQHNDGVGHTSFEVTGSYTYQWSPSHAGSYFYHCHVNTVLHVQMGMFGLLVVDPTSGRGKVFEHGPRYDVEAFIVPFEIDPTWHDHNQAAGLDGEDVGLHDFNPQYFLINGVAAENPTDLLNRQIVDDPRTTIRARVNQKILVRFLNGGYFPVVLQLGNDAQPLSGRVYGHDARPFVKINPKTGKPVKRKGKVVHPFEVVPEAGTRAISVAEREEIIIDAPSEPGTYFATVFFQHWIRGRREARIDVPIIVEP